MGKKRYAATISVGLAAALMLSACSSGGTDNGSGDSTSGGATKTVAQKTVPTTKGDGKTVTVWVMNGDYTQKTIDAINEKFKEETGATAKVEIQQWDGIVTKINTALAGSPPDILDLGNTQVASFASAGGLMDLSAYKKDLEQGRTWMDGLVNPATIEGSLYGVPGFAGVRAVIYNKKMWADAGITTAPTTYDELTADLDKVKAKNTSPDFSAFYLPGQYFYAGLQWVWDAGGSIATEKDGKWTAGFESAKAQKGLEAFKEFQNKYSSKASQTLDTDKPDMQQLFADGKTSAITATNSAIQLILDANKKMTKDDLGTFPMPGISGKTQPVMTGGSDWGIAAKSKNQDLALQWVKIAASPEIQDKWVYGNDRWIPNSKEGIDAAQATLDDIDKAFFTAALNSDATPANGNWTTLESDKSINQLFSNIASGSKSTKDAAKTFDTHADDVLNQQN